MTPSPDAEPLDEFGLPLAWRRPEPMFELDESLLEPWETFAEWCRRGGRRPFPADAPTVMDFLVDGPLYGPELRAAWDAINLQHERLYWNSNANPTLRLRFHEGISVWPDGTVTRGGEGEAGEPPTEVVVLRASG